MTLDPSPRPDPDLGGSAPAAGSRGPRRRHGEEEAVSRRFERALPAEERRPAERGEGIEARFGEPRAVLPQPDDAGLHAGAGQRGKEPRLRIPGPGRRERRRGDPEHGAATSVEVDLVPLLPVRALTPGEPRHHEYGGRPAPA